VTDLSADAAVARGASRLRPGTLGGRIRRASADFWLEFMFWWAERYPRMVLWTRPFFLWFAWRFATTLCDGTRANARRLLGERATEAACDALMKDIIRNFYLSVYELAESVRMTPQQLRAHIDGIEGGENYAAARASGRGAILVTAHLGSFELGVAALLDRERRVHVVFRRDEFPRFERLRSRLRARLGVVEAPVDEGWPVWIRLRDALLADEVVMIQGDRVMPGQRGVAVPFMSGHIRLPTGPIKLARATGAPIIPVFSIRTLVHRVRIVVDTPIEVRRSDQARSDDAGHTALLKLAGAIERQVSRHPQQWMMVEPVWCEDRHGMH